MASRGPRRCSWPPRRPLWPWSVVQYSRPSLSGCPTCAASSGWWRLLSAWLAPSWCTLLTLSLTEMPPWPGFISWVSTTYLGCLCLACLHQILRVRPRRVSWASRSPSSMVGDFRKVDNCINQANSHQPSETSLARSSFETTRRHTILWVSEACFAHSQLWRLPVWPITPFV